MATPDSAVDRELLAHVRRLLATPERPQRLWPAVAAAGLLAVSALVFATAMLVAPPLTNEHVAWERGVE